VVGGLSAFGGLVGAWMIATRSVMEANQQVALVGGLAMLLFYGLGALSLIWLGIGTLRARRWGRALMLVSSWLWLVIDGLLACGVVVLIAAKAGPHVGRAESLFLIPAAGIGLLVFVGMPLAFVLVLGRPGMKEAVEQLDPTPRWTDRRPLAILGTSLALAWLSFAFALLACGDATLWHLHGASARMGYALLSLVMVVCTGGLWRGLAVTLVVTALAYLGLVASLSADLWESAGFWPFLVAVPMYVAGAAFLWRLRRHVV
jgi:hypothetical protein